MNKLCLSAVGLDCKKLPFMFVSTGNPSINSVTTLFRATQQIFK